MGTNDIFGAGGFKTTPIEGEEAAQHRAMFDAISRQWAVVEDAANAIRFVKAAPKIVAVVAAVFAISAAISALGRIYGLTP